MSENKIFKFSSTYNSYGTNEDEINCDEENFSRFSIGTSIVFFPKEITTDYVCDSTPAERKKRVFDSLRWLSKIPLTKKLLSVLFITKGDGDTLNSFLLCRFLFVFQRIS